MATKKDNAKIIAVGFELNFENHSEFLNNLVTNQDYPNNNLFSSSEWETKYKILSGVFYGSITRNSLFEKKVGFQDNQISFVL